MEEQGELVRQVIVAFNLRIDSPLVGQIGLVGRFCIFTKRLRRIWTNRACSTQVDLLRLRWFLHLNVFENVVM